MKKLYLTRLIIAGFILLAAIFAVAGFYPFNFLSTEFTPVFQRILIDFSAIALLLFLFVIIVTFIFGRIYCSVICPFGILQEFADLIFSKIFKRKNERQKNYGFKYIITAVTFGALIGGTALLIRYIDPYTIFGSFVSLSIYGVIVSLAVLAIVFYKNRFFCTNICPVGAVLGLISKVSVNKIYIKKDSCVSCGLCAKSCPSGCIDFKEKTVDNETCIKCFKCLAVCKKDAAAYGTVPVKFNPKRRDFIWAASALVILGAAIKGGAEISKNFVKKVKDIILPPGAKNANRMANTCLNCNLCIENCPNKILVKASNVFPAVHIDYNKGEGFCKFDCTECSNACPSGAIAKISLDEKQNTRIAMASIKEENCTQCGICISECPKGAISKVEGKTVIDSSKCIGCAKCKQSCRFDAIEVFSINEQRRI